MCGSSVRVSAAYRYLEYEEQRGRGVCGSSVRVSAAYRYLEYEEQRGRKS
jgi:hypothetical protein